MKSIYTIALLLFFANTNAIAQNLIPNPSFESHTDCPATPFGGSSGSFGCDNWVTANWSPDYYNVCDTGYMGIPSNLMGYQYAQEGNAYVGMFAYNMLGGYDYDEYIMAHLTAPLEVDTPYIITIHVSVADSSRFAVNDFGVYFDTYGQPAQTIGDYNLGVSPQFAFNSYGVVTDAANWTTFTKIYVPDSAYTYFIFGDFGNGYEVDTVRQPTPGSMAWQYAYYYVDNISVQKVSYTSVTSTLNEHPACNVYPDPFTASAVITFNNSLGAQADLSVYDMQGREVRSIQGISGNHVTIERGDLPSGIYLYRLQAAGSLLGQGRMQIR